jgi:hypothetical protein
MCRFAAGFRAKDPMRGPREWFAWRHVPLVPKTREVAESLLLTTPHSKSPPVVVLSRPESPSISYGDLTPVEVVKLPNTDLPA